MKRTAINKVSKRRSVEGRIYSKRRLIYLQQNPHCLIHAPGCSYFATTIEHTKGRSGKLFLDEKFWLPACLYCNLYLKNNPAWAETHGFRLDRIGNL